jgi:hypothetical protein
VLCKPLKLSKRLHTSETLKNAVFSDINTQFVPLRRHITSILQRPAVVCYARSEVSMAVTMKNVFWEINPQFVPHRRHITSPLQTSAA